MDCDYTLRLYIELEKRLIKHGFYSLFRNLLMMAHRVLSESEEEGFLIDRKYLSKIIVEFGNCAAANTLFAMQRVNSSERISFFMVAPFIIWLIFRIFARVSYIILLISFGLL